MRHVSRAARDRFGVAAPGPGGSVADRYRQGIRAAWAGRFKWLKYPKKIKRLMFANISNKTIDKHFYLRYYKDTKQIGGKHYGKQHYLWLCPSIFG